MLIEATNVSNLSVARYFAAWNIDFVSFQFDPEHPLFIHPSNALEIKNWLAGPQYGGVFNQHALKEIQDVIELMDLTYVRLPFDRRNQASEIDINTIVSCNLDEYVQIQKEELEGIHGLDITGDWNEIKKLVSKKFFVHPQQLTSAQVQEILEFDLDGLILSGWNELEVGLADFDEMDNVMSTLRDSNH